MKKITFLTMMCMAVSTCSWAATLPRTAVKQLTLSIYGIYTSSDPTCATGLIATVSLAATPTDRDMVSSPTLGTGPVASPIKCVVVIAKNGVTNGWKSKEEAGVESYNVDTEPTACDAGSAGTKKAICGNKTPAESPYWPEQISTDMAAAGLTKTTTCTGSTDEIIPIYLSTYAACVGTATADAGVDGCQISEGGGGSYPANDAFSAPTEENQLTKGVKLTAPEAASRYKFIVDPEGTIGYQDVDGDGPNCTDLGPPRFAFEAAE